MKINVAETKRVLACFFDVLEDYKAADAFDFVAKGLKRAGGRRRYGPSKSSSSDFNSGAPMGSRSKNFGGRIVR